jgi:hypothetical protein
MIFSTSLIVLLIAILLGAWFILDDSNESDELSWNDAIFGAITALVGYLFNTFVEFVKEYRYSSTLTLIENRMKETVYVQWGTQKEDCWGFGDFLPLEPNHVVSRKVKHGNLRYFSKAPCVKISQDKNSTYKNATIILFEPSELYHTKVYEVTENGIQEFRNPDHRHWHMGDMKCYQTE